MRKATATYTPADGESDVVEMGGVTFKAGEAVEINSDDHPHLIAKLPGNKHFDVEMGEEEASPKKNKGGRPSNAEKAAREQAEADAAAAES